MDDKEPKTEPERTAREESAVLRGWLQLADHVLNQSKAEDEPLEEPAGDTPA